MRLTLIFALSAIAVGASAQVWEKQLAPGLTYRMEVAAGPRLIHALRFTPAAPDLKLSVELAGGTLNEEGTVKGRLTPGKVVEQTGALAAINADFFSFDHGAPIGLTVRSGELVTSPFKARSVFAWGSELAFGMPAFKGSLTDDAGLDLSIESINQPVGQNRIAVYTPMAGFIEPPADNLVAVVKIDRPVIRANDLVNGTVEYLIADAKKMAVPEGKMLIVARGNKAPLLSVLRPEHKVKLKIETSPFDWAKVENAVGGGPMLLSNGKLVSSGSDFAPSFTEARHPRSAVGRTKEGDIWLVAIDGRQSMSIGASLSETAEIMQSLGCVDALNLDGGGSTNLHVLGITVNRPSDAIERPVSNVLLINGPKSPALKGKAEIKVPSRLGPGTQVEAKLLIDGKEVPQADVIWSMQGAAWIDQGGLIRAMDKGKATLRAYSGGLIATTEVLVSEEPPPVLKQAKPSTPAKVATVTKKQVARRKPTLKISITSSKRVGRRN